ncbi:MAG: hypothetical protein L3J05_03295, partial [Robiginitomaculum sp.]|nr:hypothetical protein [Robiginitomaculum sp.]
MSDPTLTCPECGTSIKLNESLAGPLLAEARHEFAEKLRQKNAKMAVQQAKLEAEQAALDEKLKRALFICNISHFCRSQAMIFCPPEKWDRLHIIHCGVDPDLFEPVTHSGRGTRLLTVGRLASVKGTPVLLDAVKTLLPDHP